MPEKVKVNTEEEKVVQQVAQVFGQLLNYEVSGEREEKGYGLYLKDPADQKTYKLGSLFSKKNKTTGESYYEVPLYFNVILPAYINRGFIPISAYSQEPEFLATLRLMDEIKRKIKEPLEKENLEIIGSEVVSKSSFVFDLKKQPLA